MCERTPTCGETVNNNDTLAGMFGMTGTPIGPGMTILEAGITHPDQMCAACQKRWPLEMLLKELHKS